MRRRCCSILSGSPTPFPLPCEALLNSRVRLPAQSVRPQSPREGFPESTHPHTAPPLRKRTGMNHATHAAPLSTVRSGVGFPALGSLADTPLGAFNRPTHDGRKSPVAHESALAWQSRRLGAAMASRMRGAGTSAHVGWRDGAGHACGSRTAGCWERDAHANAGRHAGALKNLNRKGLFLLDGTHPSNLVSRESSEKEHVGVPLLNRDRHRNRSARTAVARR